MTSSAADAGAHAPELVALGAREGTAAHPGPPVRIFLGSEPAQHRAERTFLWSIECVRDSSRIYEIYLMKDLAGFDRRGWTTGFSNYRFAVPHFTGGAGRAIYNDVDQIYLADPAQLFDCDMGTAGVLSLPGDASVMLLDCARAGEVWNLVSAQRESKRRLLELAGARPGLLGPLPREWNARDGEYEPGCSKLLHFTTLHTQPWRPFPERYVYQAHREEELWQALEDSADAAGFQVFTRERPSRAYRAYRACRADCAQRADPAAPADGAEDLAAVPEEDLPWVLDEAFRAAAPCFRAHLRCAPPRTPAWWVERLEAASARHPGVHWEVELTRHGRSALHTGGRRLDPAPPRVWVLADDRPGNTNQSLGLIETLGWPYELKRLHLGPLSALHNRILGASRLGLRRSSPPLEPPWPDLVIAAGRRTAPVAQWIRRQSLRREEAGAEPGTEGRRGATRLVHLGRKGGDVAGLLDLSVVPEYCRLFPHPRRVATSAPLHRLTPEKLAAAAAEWEGRLEAAARPRVAVLVGGPSGQFDLDAATGRRLGEEAMRLARAAGASLVATTSRRTPEAAAEAFCEAVEGAAFVHRWSPADTPADNPYLGFLATADAIVVTGDSESMLGEAISLGKPVYIVPLPVRRSFRLLGLVRDWVYARATARPPGPRATPRPQRGLERLCGRLIEWGLARPSRDLTVLHDVLERRGLARPFGEPIATAPAAGPPHDDRREVARRVRALMGVPEPGAPEPAPPQT